MKLKVKDVNLSTGGPLVAILNEKDAKQLDLHALDRIKISKNKDLTVVIDTTTKGIKQGYIGLFEEVLKILKVSNNEIVNVHAEKIPNSIGYIKKKLKGGTLNENEIDEIVRDVISNKLNVVELTYFVSGCYTNGLNLKETECLTNSLVKNSSQLKFNNKIVLDKHSVGGIPNNRTTMIVVPIIAAAGFLIPKTSSRSITSASGTANTMEVLAPVELTKEKIKSVVKKTNGCIVWGGIDLASADNNFINIERPLSLDPTGILLSSILAKKKAVNATHILVDIPTGKGAKIKSYKRAKGLKKGFIKLGKRLGMKIKVIITNGSEPIGNGIGPALEARDVISVLRGNGPSDLREKSIYMASLMLKMVGIKNAKERVLDILNSGKAYEKMKEIVEAQGGSLSNIKIGKYFHIIESIKSGRVKNINNEAVTKLARIAGAPKDKGAGIYLNVHKHYKVKKKQPLFAIYAESRIKLNFALEELKNLKAVEIE